MLRAVLVGLLSLSVVNCTSRDEGVKAQAGVAAGSVIKVEGTVTLHHGDATRPLVKGDTVEGDDIVETGADGSVVIELAHNHVTWELAANKKGKVRESLAWGQPNKDTGAKAVEEDTAAAGRHAERSAVETSVSGAASPSAPAPVEVEKQERDVELKVDDKKSEKKVETRERAKAEAPKAALPATTTATKDAVKSPPPPPPGPPAKITAQSAESVQSVQSAQPPPDLQPAPGGGGKVSSDPGLGSIGSVGKGAGGGGAGDGAGVGASVTANKSAETAALDLIGTKQKELNACVAGQATALRVVIRVDASGKATAVFDAGASAAIKSCVTKVIQKLAFQPHAVSATVQLKP